MLQTLKKNKPTDSIHDVHHVIMLSLCLSIKGMVLLSEIAIRMYLYFLYCLETRCVYANLSPSLHLGKKPPSCEVPFPSSPLPGNKHNMNKTWPICQDLRIQPSFHLFLLQMIGV